MRINKTIVITALSLAILAPMRASAAPSITVSYPQENDIITDKKITVKGSVSDPSGLTDLIINGKGFTLKQSKNMDFERKITLAPGGNSILVTAINSAGEVTEREVFVQYTPPGVKPLAPASSEKPAAAQVAKSQQAEQAGPPAQPQTRQQPAESRPEREIAQPQPRQPRQTISEEKLGKLPESELVSSLPADAHNVSSKQPSDQGEPGVEPAPGLMPLPLPASAQGSEKSPEPITEPSPELIKPYPGEPPAKKTEPVPEVVFPENSEIEAVSPGKTAKSQKSAKTDSNATITQAPSTTPKTENNPLVKPENQKATTHTPQNDENVKNEITQQRKIDDKDPVVETKTDKTAKTTEAAETSAKPEKKEPAAKPEAKKEAEVKEAPEPKKEAEPKKTAEAKKEPKPSTEKKETAAAKTTSATPSAPEKNKETEKPQAVASAEKQPSSDRRPVGGTATPASEIPAPKKPPTPAAPKDNGLYTGECRVLAAGSYLYIENADAAAKDIAKNGIGTSVFEEKIGKTTIYHIVIGIYRTQADAEAAAANFKLPGYKPAVSKTWCENVKFPDLKSLSAPPAKRDNKSDGSDIKLREDNTTPVYK